MIKLGYGIRRLGRYAWYDPRHFPDFIRKNEYFVFVEDVALVSSESLLRPDGLPISGDTYLGSRPWRFRASGIRAREFLDVMERIDEVDHDTVTDGQRRFRREQLIEELGPVELPLFDIYVDDSDEDLPFLRSSLVPGAWYWIGVQQRFEGDESLAVFVGAEELAPGPYLPGSLAFLEAVPLYIEYRLRDIFSLVHVPDLGLEEAGGEVAPPPGDPHDGAKVAEWLLDPFQPDLDQQSPTQKLET